MRFLTLSAGIAMIQNEKAPSPPDKKFARPVLISKRVPCSELNPRIRTSNEENIQKKLLLNARLPVKPVHMPSGPCTRTICLAQSIGPLNWRSVLALWSWSCNLTLSSSTGVAIIALRASINRRRRSIKRPRSPCQPCKKPGDTVPNNSQSLNVTACYLFGHVVLYEEQSVVVQ